MIALFQPNDFYPDDDAYLDALAEAMRPEYEAIAAAGLILQLDSPDLGLGRHMMYKDRPEHEYLVRIERHVAVLNHALRKRAGGAGADARLLGQLRGAAPLRCQRWRRSCRFS